VLGLSPHAHRPTCSPALEAHDYELGGRLHHAVHVGHLDVSALTRGFLDEPGALHPFGSQGSGHFLTSQADVHDVRVPIGQRAHLTSVASWARATLVSLDDQAAHSPACFPGGHLPSRRGRTRDRSCGEGASARAYHHRTPSARGLFCEPTPLSVLRHPTRTPATNAAMSDSTVPHRVSDRERPQPSWALLATNPRELGFASPAGACHRSHEAQARHCGRRWARSHRVILQCTCATCWQGNRRAGTGDAPAASSLCRTPRFRVVEPHRHQRGTTASAHEGFPLVEPQRVAFCLRFMVTMSSANPARFHYLNTHFVGRKRQGWTDVVLCDCPPVPTSFRVARLVWSAVNQLLRLQSRAPIRPMRLALPLPAARPHASCLRPRISRGVPVGGRPVQPLRSAPSRCGFRGSVLLRGLRLARPVGRVSARTSVRLRTQAGPSQPDYIACSEGGRFRACSSSTVGAHLPNCRALVGHGPPIPGSLGAL